MTPQERIEQALDEAGVTKADDQVQGYCLAHAPMERW
jgi:hypothetical protein